MQASPESWPRDRFTSETWKLTQREKRFALYNDLATRKLLDGKSKADVTGLLGTPDFEAPDGRYVTYVVRETSPSEYTFNAIYLLQVDLDGKGSVTKYFVRGK
jgi:hypothetical protein